MPADGGEAELLTAFKGSVSDFPGRRIRNDWR
jgi:hypothetical protein